MSLTSSPKSSSTPASCDSSASPHYREALFLRSVLKNPWIPHRPTARQAEFLRLSCREALYGGSAGGGKSDALLMAALQFAEVPGYAALLRRRTYTDLALRGALMDRAQEWLAGTAARWSDKDKTWHFPSGATLTFGYLETARDHLRYQSSEYQFVGFDELTQFPHEGQYTYLFSRLRRLAGTRVPLRMRAGSNPGGPGHLWVRDRFPILTANTPERVFVPARLDDNPHLDRAEYLQSLGELAPVERARLLNGDWTIQNEGLVFPGLFGCVIDPCPVRPARVFGGVDFGWHNPACLLVGVVDQDDVLHVVAEEYGSHLTMEGPKDGDAAHNRNDLVARAVALQARFGVELWFCDPAEPRSLEILRRHDLPARKAYNDILPGVQAVNARIRTGRVKVFRDCTNLISEGGVYRYPTPEEKRLANELPVDAHNHACSALRYLAFSYDRIRGVYRRGAEEVRAEAGEPAESPRTTTVAQREHGPRGAGRGAEEAGQFPLEGQAESPRWWLGEGPGWENVW
jgi:hypothetical protein